MEKGRSYGSACRKSHLKCWACYAKDYLERDGPQLIYLWWRPTHSNKQTARTLTNQTSASHTVLFAHLIHLNKLTLTTERRRVAGERCVFYLRSISRFTRSIVNLFCYDDWTKGRREAEMRKKKRKVYRVRLRLFINNLAAIETTLKAAQWQLAHAPSSNRMRINQWVKRAWIVFYLILPTFSPFVRSASSRSGSHVFIFLVNQRPFKRAFLWPVTPSLLSF